MVAAGFYINQVHFLQFHQHILLFVDTFSRIFIKVIRNWQVNNTVINRPFDQNGVKGGEWFLCGVERWCLNGGSQREIHVCQKLYVCKHRNGSKRHQNSCILCGDCYILEKYNASRGIASLCLLKGAEVMPSGTTKNSKQRIIWLFPNSKECLISKFERHESMGK